MTATPRLLPVVVASLLSLGALKAVSFFVGFSSAAAESSTPSALAAKPLAPVEAPKSEAEKRLLDQLSSRKAALDAREAELDTREKLLGGAERRLDDKIAALQSERRAFATQATERDRQQTSEFESLSSAYEKMKPKDAARIFDILEDDVLVPVAAGMRTISLSAVLAEMNPDRAKALTRKLADRGALAKASNTLPASAQ